MKKLLQLKTMLLLCALIVGSGSVWAADTYTIEFKSASSDSSSDLGATPSVSKVIASGAGYVESFSDCQKIYVGKNGIKLGTGSDTGTLNFTLATSYQSNIKSIKVVSAQYGSDKGTLTLYSGSTSLKSGITPGTDYTHTFDTPTTVTSIKLTTSTKRAYITKIILTAENKTPAGLAYETSSYTVLPGASFETPTLTNPNGLDVTYSITTNGTGSTIDSSTGEVTIGSVEGTETVTATSAETDTYAEGNATYTITVAKGVTTVTLNNSALTFNIVDGTTQTLTATAKYNETTLDDPAITWTSSNKDVATVTNGVVSAMAPGNATITATYPGNTIYATSSNTCAVTVNKAATTLTLDKAEAAIDLKNIGARTVTLNPSVTATKSDESTVAVSTPTITWTSSDETVATVEGGVVTALKVGSATITASYAGGTNYNAAENKTCAITVSDSRTAVNMTAFTATSSTLVIGNTTTTEITNDQTGWTEAYTYSSDNTDVATVNASGVVTAVAKGTANITATLNVNGDDPDYKAGGTFSKTIEITVTKPFHTVTFSVNGNTDRTASVEEDQPITFPTAADSPEGDQFNKVINGMTFVGWYGDTYSNASVAPSYVNTAATNMGNDDVTYYAVYADVVESESDKLEDCVISQTLQYDTWSYSGSTTDKDTYRMFHTGSYIESEGFDLSKLMKVIVYGGTFGGGTYNSLTIGDGSNTWKDVTVSGNSETKANTFTGGTALSGTKKLRVTSNSGTASSTGIRISKVEIFVKGTISSYENFTTTVSNLPRPEITMADVEMTWGDTDKSVAPSATINEEAYEGSFAFTSSSPNLTVASDGKLTCDVPGNYTVTASIEAKGSYQAAEKTCNVTVNKRDVTLAFENPEVIKNVNDKSYTQTATKAPIAYDGVITYAITSSTSAGATVDGSTGTVTFTKIGVITITATGAETSLYNSCNTSYNLYVKTNPTITVSDQTLAIGETYEPSITSTGAVTIVSDPVGMITTEGNVITAAAIGTATVTVSTAASDTYFAEEKSFTLTINGPVASDTKQNTSSTTTFTDKDLNHSGGVDWTASKAANSFETQNPARGVQFGAGIGTFTLSTSAYTGNITKVSVFSSTNDSGNTMSVKVGSTDFKCSDETTVTLSGNNQTYDFVGEATGNIVISCNDKNKSIYFKSITVELYTNASVTIAASGYGTYCYEYPLTLANTDDYKAYIVTNVSENTVTFTNVTGDIKGGVPFILYGNEGTYDIALADASTTVPAGNMLKGTLAPTYVTTVEGDYTNFGLSGGEFKKINNGIVPANKAYLPVLTSELPASGRLSIVFEDEETGIKSMRDSGKFLDNTVYNLRGQRVENPTKGLYIVNGRKVVVK